MTKKSLTIVEGPRGSGKTYLIDNAGIKKTYKFPFVQFVEQAQMQEGPATHAFGYSKEIMLHDLIKNGYIDEHVLMDRGVISHWVWSLINCRQSKTQVINEIHAFKNAGFFEFVNIVFVTAEEAFDRGPKDRYDSMDYQTELEAYEWVIEQIKRIALLWPIKFVNKGTQASVKSFRNLMFSVDVELNKQSDPFGDRWQSHPSAAKYLI